jgi:hypothetical protein
VEDSAAVHHATARIEITQATTNRGRVFIGRGPEIEEYIPLSPKSEMLHGMMDIAQCEKPVESQSQSNQ